MVNGLIEKSVFLLDREKEQVLTNHPMNKKLYKEKTIAEDFDRDSHKAVLI